MRHGQIDSTVHKWRVAARVFGDVAGDSYAGVLIQPGFLSHHLAIAMPANLDANGLAFGVTNIATRFDSQISAAARGAGDPLGFILGTGHNHRLRPIASAKDTFLRGLIASTLAAAAAPTRPSPQWLSRPGGQVNSSTSRPVVSDFNRCRFSAV